MTDIYSEHSYIHNQTRISKNQIGYQTNYILYSVVLLANPIK